MTWKLFQISFGEKYAERWFILGKIKLYQTEISEEPN